VVGGLIENASPTSSGLARLDSNGELDTTFGDGGTLTVDNAVNAPLIDANVAGEGVSNYRIDLARYLAI
jgi:hypothetical protein